MTHSHIYTGELKFDFDHNFCVTSGGTPGLYWENPRFPRTLVEDHCSSH